MTPPLAVQEVQWQHAPGAPSAANQNGSTVVPTIRFSDATSAFNIVPRSTSFGAGAWGDFNGDGWPDLFVGNHSFGAGLYINQGDGTLVDQAASIFIPYSNYDSHGAAWADFDRDGDQDLIELVGAASGNGIGPNRLWRNDAGVLTDWASTLDVDFPTGRGRTPLWFDWDDDGDLDLLTTNAVSPVSVDRMYSQQANQIFLDESASNGFVGTGLITRFPILSDFDSNGRMDLLLQVESFPDLLYEFSSAGFVPLSPIIQSQPITSVNDIGAGDFDGDLDIDYYASRTPFWNEIEVKQTEPTVIRAALVSNKKTLSYNFRNSVGFELQLLETFPRHTIFIGASRLPVPANGPIVLDATDRNTEGIIRPPAETEIGLFIGREPGSDRWEFNASTDGERIALTMILQSLVPFEDLSTSFDGLTRPTDRFLRNSPTGLVEEIAVPGISARSVGVGDFDNDMDLDIYLVRSGAAVNEANSLLLNNGFGQFTLVPGGGGASGNQKGVGDSVSIVDYDQDGFLDLFVTHGAADRLLAKDAKVQLFRNDGNSNHWIQFDLRGTVSNPEGVGARVEVTAGGVTQVREQGGGIHRFTQNHQRIHFGLAGETQVSSVTVYWPSGIVQTLTNLNADQILTIVEA